MKQHLNTLFVMTQGAYLAKDGATVDVRVERESALRVPVHNLGGIVCFGNVGASPALMAMCGVRRRCPVPVRTRPLSRAGQWILSWQRAAATRAVPVG